MQRMWFGNQQQGRSLSKMRRETPPNQRVRVAGFDIVWAAYHSAYVLRRLRWGASQNRDTRHRDIWHRNANPKGGKLKGLYARGFDDNRPVGIAAV
ncbi:MAG: hypothetical protein ACFUZC_18900 [Chthoniobacteraceae bacterium]